MIKRILAFIMAFVVVTLMLVTSIGASPQMDTLQTVARVLVFDINGDYEPYMIVQADINGNFEDGFHLGLFRHLFGDEFFTDFHTYDGVISVPMFDGSVLSFNFYNGYFNVCHIQTDVKGVHNYHFFTYDGNVGQFDVQIYYDYSGVLRLMFYDVSDGNQFQVDNAPTSLLDSTIPYRVYEQDILDEMYFEGYYRGVTEGGEAGYTNGYNDGIYEGRSEGYTEGYDKGKTDGIKETHGTAYSAGMAYAKKYFESEMQPQWIAQGYAEGFEEGKEFMHDYLHENIPSTWLDNTYTEGYNTGYSEALKNGEYNAQKYYERGFFDGQNSEAIVGNAVEGFFDGLSGFASQFMQMGVGSLTVYNLVAVLLVAVVVVIIMKVGRK